MFEMKFNCPENTAAMKPSNQGRHCDSCNRDIVDFSSMSNAEIKKALSSQSGATCGIVNSKQLVNPYRSKMVSQFRMAFVFVFFMGLSSHQLMAQDSLQVAPVEQSECANCFYTIKGTVYDADSLVIPFARVWVELDSVNGEANHLHRITDIDGNYEFQIPANQKAPVDLYARFMGYETLGVTDIQFKYDGEVAKVDIHFTEDLALEFHVVGLMVPIQRAVHSPAGKDGYEIGKTVLDGDDIRDWE